MKKTICALALGLAAVTGCELPPQEMRYEKMKLPAGCVKVESVSGGFLERYLTCRGKDQQTIFYRYDFIEKQWTRYDVVDNESK